MDRKTCNHCGGEVGEDGHAMNLAELEQHQPIEGDETEQQESTEAMRDEAFVDALGGRRHEEPKKMAEGGMALPERKDTGPKLQTVDPYAEDMRKRKADKYGFMKNARKP